MAIKKKRSSSLPPARKRAGSKSAKRLRSFSANAREKLRSTTHALDKLFISQHRQKQPEQANPMTEAEVKDKFAALQVLQNTMAEKCKFITAKNISDYQDAAIMLKVDFKAMWDIDNKMQKATEEQMPELEKKRQAVMENIHKCYKTFKAIEPLMLEAEKKSKDLQLFQTEYNILSKRLASANTSDATKQKINSTIIEFKPVVRGLELISEAGADKKMFSLMQNREGQTRSFDAIYTAEFKHAPKQNQRKGNFLGAHRSAEHVSPKKERNIDEEWAQLQKELGLDKPPTPGRRNTR